MLLNSAGRVCLALFGVAGCFAQDAGNAGQSDVLPVRLELGAYGSQLNRNLGTWRGLQGQLWIRSNPRFVPALIFDTQTRPEGTQQNYGFLSYLNWSKSFYTVQGFSAAPQRNERSIFFPKRRYDIKAYWKVPPTRNFVLGAGFTRFDYGGPGHGQIFNAGALYYHKKLVMEGNLFVNRNQPGDFVSAAGTLAAQYGTEGNYWFGVTAGGGREQYRFTDITPAEIRLLSYSINTFYRKWLSRHVGFVVSFDYQDKLTAYRRAGLSTGLFFEF
ncbi:MAG TPA: YaiO family outer membrane beta-barrel protein [Bryobacteraceae bacterium]|nr:YaiO family outer membrane beta-barrel protein [Bryobacteraceae bacterium]